MYDSGNLICSYLEQIMSVRPPQFFLDLEKDPLAAALEQEILSEKAGTLSRLTKKLERALAIFENGKGDSGLTEEERLRQLAEAAETLWHVTIQRELCGLRQHKAFYDFLKIPKEVRLCMGPKKSLLSRAFVDNASQNPPD
jgi:uncharacterized protein DUF6665